MTTPFSLQERQELLGRYFPAYQRWQDIDYQLAVAGSTSQPDLTKEYDELGRSLMDLRARYQAGLPFLPISRCPFSRQVVYHSLDPFGTDGLWWNYTAPVRPVENLPVTFHGITGALSLNGPPEQAPFLCVPGPGAPYVLPAVLSPDHVKAVVSTIPIGSHTGYAILYFTSREQDPAPRPDSWGMDHWEQLGRSGTFEWGESTPAAQKADFGLAPWIEKEKLLWIRKEDHTLTLKSGTEGCPYLGISGTHGIQRIRAGRVWQDGEQERR
jgi:hypothetical protein